MTALCDYELQVLRRLVRHAHGDAATAVYGAAFNAACEVLRAHGLIDAACGVTQAGMARLHDELNRAAATPALHGEGVEARIAQYQAGRGELS